MPSTCVGKLERSPLRLLCAQTGQESAFECAIASGMRAGLAARRRAEVRARVTEGGGSDHGVAGR